MYRMPSRRRNVVTHRDQINLVPMMDTVLNLIFFLLVISSFLPLANISSPLPLVSDSEPPKDKPLALTLSISSDKIVVEAGAPGKVLKSFSKEGEDYPWEDLHTFLIEMKKKYPQEDSAIIEPEKDVSYMNIVKLMDSIRVLRKSDEALYGKDSAGVPVRLEYLFTTVLFGNITS